MALRFRSFLRHLFVWENQMKISRSKGLKAVSLLTAAILLLLSGCAGIKPGSTPETAQASSGISAPELTTGLPSGDPYEDMNSIYASPVDFAALQAENEDIYAYIYVPGTNIEYPILQSNTDDNYYLNHDYQRKSIYKGSIFTQSVNAKDFDDPVTVVYGHNTSRGDMFSELLYFRDSRFFSENEFFYIYLPGHILVYRIFSAHIYDKRHIMNSYDFSDRWTLLDFQGTLLNPTALEKNVRSDVSLNENSDIVILSTCIEASSTAAARFLVNGVLVKDVITQ